MRSVKHVTKPLEVRRHARVSFVRNPIKFRANVLIKSPFKDAIVPETSDEQGNRVGSILRQLKGSVRFPSRSARIIFHFSSPVVVTSDRMAEAGAESICAGGGLAS
jgi:hypothetical protein